MTKLNKEEFIEKARKIHNNKYDYSQVEYKNTGIKVKIISVIIYERRTLWNTLF